MAAVPDIVPLSPDEPMRPLADLPASEGERWFEAAVKSIEKYRSPDDAAAAKIAARYRTERRGGFLRKQEPIIAVNHPVNDVIQPRATVRRLYRLDDGIRLLLGPNSPEDAIAARDALLDDQERARRAHERRERHFFHEEERKKRHAEETLNVWINGSPMLRALYRAVADKSITADVRKAFEVLAGCLLYEEAHSYARGEQIPDAVLMAAGLDVFTPVPFAEEES